MKKLLVVSTSFPMKPGDGLSPFIWEFCLSLQKRGRDVTVLVPHHKNLKDREEWNGVTIRRFRYLPERFEDLGYSGGILPNIKKKPWRIVKLPFYIWAMYRESLRITVEEQFELVDFHWLFPASFWLGQFVRSSGIPVVLTGHGTDVHLASKGVFRLLANRSMKKASALTLNSDYMKTILQENLLPSRVEIIPMGVDIEKFRPREMKPSQSQTILYVGRLIKQKGVSLLVDAFGDIIGQVPDARLEIVGYGPEKENLLSALKSRRLSHAVRIVDAIPHDELPEVYRRARVLVLPSLIGEGLGMTPAEAGACGVPTITFGLGGTSELVTDEKTGLIVKPDRNALACDLLRILVDGRLADELGSNARKAVAQSLGWDEISARFDALFTEIIASRSGPQKEHMSHSAANSAAVIAFLVTVGYVVKTAADRIERILSLFK